MHEPAGRQPGQAADIGRFVACLRSLARPDAGRMLILFCCAYALGAFLLAPGDYLIVTQHYWKEFSFYLPVVLATGLMAAGLWWQPRRPWTFIIQLLRANGAAAFLTITLFAHSLTAFTTYKLNIPDVVPFYADRMFADLDELIHGAPPWQVVHGLAPGWTASVVASTYSTLWVTEWFGMVFLAAFSVRAHKQMRYLWALALTTLIVGTLLATALSSVGPIFYDEFLGGNRFDGLTTTLAQNESNRLLLGFADYLLTNYRNDTAAIGTGISAMPSMHVAIATVNALYLASLHRWLGLLGWTFALTILFGSVYTGWHYAIDGYVSIVVVAVIWRFLGAVMQEKPRATGTAETLGIESEQVRGLTGTPQVLR